MYVIWKIICFLYKYKQVPNKPNTDTMQASSNKPATTYSNNFNAERGEDFLMIDYEKY